MLSFKHTAHLQYLAASVFRAWRYAVLGTLLISQPALSALVELGEDDLDDISGQVGLIVDDFKFFGHPDANIQLTFDTSLANDSGYLDHLSIYGSDSSAGCNANPNFNLCSGFTIGTASDPMRLNVKTESSISFLEFLFPQNSSSESGIDADFRVLTNTYLNTGKIDISWVKLRNLKLAGTTMKLWSHGVLAGYNGGIPLGASIENVLNAQFDLSIDFANSRAVSNEFEKLPPFSTNDKPRGLDAGILRLEGVELTNMRLGLFPHIPVTGGTINRDTGSTGHDPALCSATTCAPDLYIESPLVPNTPAIYNALYATDKATVKINQVFIGDDNAGNAFSAGSLEMRDIRIQHVRIETRG